LRAEQEHHLRAAAFADDANARLEHCGVVRWLDEVLTGVLPERYAKLANDELGLAEVDEVLAGAPGGSEYMESDGLSEEV
jgi:hypothetical protein